MGCRKQEVLDGDGWPFITLTTQCDADAGYCECGRDAWHSGGDNFNRAAIGADWTNVAGMTACVVCVARPHPTPQQEQADDRTQSSDEVPYLQ